MIDEKEAKEFCEWMGWKYITFISEDEFCVVRRNASLFFVTPDELSRLLALHAVAKAAKKFERADRSEHLVTRLNDSEMDACNAMFKALARLAEVGGGK